jgi:hypothetical protein
MRHANSLQQHSDVKDKEIIRKLTYHKANLIEKCCGKCRLTTCFPAAFAQPVQTFH